MGISQQIEAVYQRALLLRERATSNAGQKDAGQKDLIDSALKELYFVLEELRTADEDLHQQNQALAASRHEIEVERQRYRTLFELAPDGYLVTDSQGKIHHANRAAAGLMGRDTEALLGKPMRGLVIPEDRPYLDQQLLQLNHESHWQMALHRRSGEPVVVSVSTADLKDAHNQPVAILWSLRDVTERHRLEQELKAAHDNLERQVAERTAALAEANAQLRHEIKQHQRAEQKIRNQAALIDIATDAIYVEDKDHYITFWSRGATRLYGWTEAEALGKQGVDLLSPASGSASLDAVMAEDNDENWQGEALHQTKGGDRVIVFTRKTRMPNTAGCTALTLVVNTDITEKKQLQAEFYQAQRLESLGNLARGIAHDFKNILNPVRIIPQLLLRKLPDADHKTKEMLRSLISASDRGVALCQQILSFAGQYQAGAEPVPIAKVLEELEHFIRPSFPKNIKIQTEVADGLNSVLVDGTLMHQVLMNLCVNARDAMPEGGTLHISVGNVQLDAPEPLPRSEAHVGTYAMITIADTGAGIPNHVLDQIYKPFFSTKDPDQGTGLGLSTVARIVKDLGGFVQVTSEVGQGTEFRVYLPEAGCRS